MALINERSQLGSHTLLPVNLSIDGMSTLGEEHCRMAFTADGNPHQKLLRELLHCRKLDLRTSVFLVSSVLAIISWHLIMLEGKIGLIIHHNADV